MFYANLSGYVLPGGDLWAPRFEMEKDLGLTEDYAVPATEYGLDLLPKITPLDLAERGTSGHYSPHAVVITHENGRSKGDVALYGVTDLDRSFRSLLKSKRAPERGDDLS